MPEASRPLPPYVDDIRRLLVDATAHRREHALADAMTYALASLMVEHGPLACGAVLESIGRHVAGIGESRKAAADAAHAREDGAATH